MIYTWIKLAASDSLFNVGSAVSDDGTDDRKLLLRSISWRDSKSVTNQIWHSLNIHERYCSHAVIVVVVASDVIIFLFSLKEKLGQKNPVAT